MKSTDFVFFGAARFTMGSSRQQEGRYEDEEATLVRVEPFLLRKYCTSQREFSELMKMNPSEVTGEDWPVDHLTWFDAVRYCNLLSHAAGLPEFYSIVRDVVSYNRRSQGFRLPTAAEWEYACKAGRKELDQEQFLPTSDTVNFFPWRSGYIEGVYRQTTVPCGSLSPDENGLHEMLGNVWEWCHNWYSSSLDIFAQDSFGSRVGTTRELRGGAWYNFSRDCRPANREHLAPNLTDHAVGFRVARSARYPGRHGTR